MPTVIIVDDTEDPPIGGGPPPPPPGSPTPPPGPPPPPAPPPTPPGTPTPPPPAVADPVPPAPNVVGSTVSAGQSLRMQRIPLAALESQRVAVQLGDQPCTIDVFVKTTGLFLSLYVSDVAVVTGALCQNANFLVRDGYLGFAGDLIFIDEEGDSDPTFDGLADRYALFWAS